VYDIDLARWFLGTEPKSIYAVGGCFAHPEYAHYNDGDNVAALMQEIRNNLFNEINFLNTLNPIS